LPKAFNKVGWRTTLDHPRKFSIVGLLTESDAAECWAVLQHDNLQRGIDHPTAGQVLDLAAGNKGVHRLDRRIGAAQD